MLKRFVTIISVFVVLVLSASAVLGARMPLATFETGEDWRGIGTGNLQYSTTHVVEGDRSLRVRMQPQQIEYAMLDVHYDMSMDGDIVVSFYNGLAEHGSATYLTMWLFFETSPGNYYYTDWTWLETLPRDTWTTLWVNKLGLTSIGCPDWANINKIWIRIRNPYDGPINEGYVWIDSILFISPGSGIMPEYRVYLPILMK